MKVKAAEPGFVQERITVPIASLRAKNAFRKCDLKTLSAILERNSSITLELDLILFSHEVRPDAPPTLPDGSIPTAKRMSLEEYEKSMATLISGLKSERLLFDCINHVPCMDRILLDWATNRYKRSVNHGHHRSSSTGDNCIEDVVTFGWYDPEKLEECASRFVQSKGLSEYTVWRAGMIARHARSEDVRLHAKSTCGPIFETFFDQAKFSLAARKLNSKLADMGDRTALLRRKIEEAVDSRMFGEVARIAKEARPASDAGVLKYAKKHLALLTPSVVEGALALKEWAAISSIASIPEEFQSSEPMRLAVERALGLSQQAARGIAESEKSNFVPYLDALAAKNDWKGLVSAAGKSEESLRESSKKYSDIGVLSESEITSAIESEASSLRLHVSSKLSGILTNAFIDCLNDDVSELIGIALIPENLLGDPGAREAASYACAKLRSCIGSFFEGERKRVISKIDDAAITNYWRAIVSEADGISSRYPAEVKLKVEALKKVPALFNSLLSEGLVSRADLVAAVSEKFPNCTEKEFKIILDWALPRIENGKSFFEDSLEHARNTGKPGNVKSGEVALECYLAIERGIPMLAQESAFQARLDSEAAFLFGHASSKLAGVLTNGFIDGAGGNLDELIAISSIPTDFQAHPGVAGAVSYSRARMCAELGSFFARERDALLPRLDVFAVKGDWNGLVSEAKGIDKEFKAKVDETIGKLKLMQESGMVSSEELSKSISAKFPSVNPKNIANIVAWALKMHGEGKRKPFFEEALEAARNAGDNVFILGGEIALDCCLMIEKSRPLKVPLEELRGVCDAETASLREHASSKLAGVLTNGFIDGVGGSLPDLMEMALIPKELQCSPSARHSVAYACVRLRAELGLFFGREMNELLPRLDGFGAKSDWKGLVSEAREIERVFRVKVQEKVEKLKGNPAVFNVIGAPGVVSKPELAGLMSAKFPAAGKAQVEKIVDAVLMKLEKGYGETFFEDLLETARKSGVASKVLDFEIALECYLTIEQGLTSAGHIAVGDADIIRIHAHASSKLGGILTKRFIEGIGRDLDALMDIMSIPEEYCVSAEMKEAMAYASFRLCSNPGRIVKEYLKGDMRRREILGTGILGSGISHKFIHEFIPHLGDDGVNLLVLSAIKACPLDEADALAKRFVLDLFSKKSRQTIWKSSNSRVVEVLVAFGPAAATPLFDYYEANPEDAGNITAIIAEIDKAVPADSGAVGVPERPADLADAVRFFDVRQMGTHKEG